MTALFRSFAERFDRRNVIVKEDPDALAGLERQLGIFLPSDLVTFLLEVGPTWTPSILDVIVDRDIDLWALQQVWTSEEIANDRANGWTSSPQVDLIPFASDPMGNIFGILPSDLRSRCAHAPILFFDHDLNTVEPEADSFTEFIERYMALPA